ncbi:MAG: hypothetical protein JWN63_273 [Candidatus Acidoferrum typicum]|jgi:hypothetical protein|nr:hypothetical protein [Candidatus Acidoferrum typicum]
MTLSLEQALTEVWRQALVENAKSVELRRNVFLFAALQSADCGRWISSSTGTTFEGLSRTQTKSQWAQLARSGKNVMQFLRRVAA